MDPNVVVNLPDYRRHLVRDGRPTVALVAYVITLVAWTVIVGELVPMPGGETTMPGGEMTLHPVAPGAAEAMGTTNGIRGVLGYLFVGA